MVVRKLAGLALAAGVLLSVAGCSFNPHPETDQSYAPSDGVGADLNYSKAQRNEAVAFRNFLIVTDGTHTTLLGSVINSGDKVENVTIQLAADTSKEQTITLQPGTSYVFNANHPSTITFTGAAGSLVDVNVGNADGTNWQKLSVPVLDSTIEYYQGATTPTPTPTN